MYYNKNYTEHYTAGDICIIIRDTDDRLREPTPVDATPNATEYVHMALNLI